MNILAIDIGTYSIKFVEVRPERKGFTLVEKQEIVLEEARIRFPNAETITQLQREVVANFINKKPQELKIIFQLPNEMLTTRYLDIPGTSKRKAEQIIPFQLDENLPYSLNQAHFSSKLQKKPNGFTAISNITQLNIFKDFISYFDSKDAGPSTLTSEISTIQTYIDHIRMNDTCCILDLGHKTTKAYLIQDRQVVSNHTSYVAGATINEVISKTYNISTEDSIIYKHENAFFLTEDQYENVSPEQKEFAIVMKQIFHPLILDIKRWDIGHRVKFGKNLDKIYILGGTSQITGLDHFIHFYTGIMVEQLPPLLDFKNDYSIHEKSFYLAKMMAISQRSPSSIINFLSGKFQSATNAFISIHSAIFIWVRTTFIAICLILGLVVERYAFLNKQEKNLDKKITEKIKKEKGQYKTNPTAVLSTFKRKNSFIKDEVQTILSSTKINALKPLAGLSKSISSNPKISLDKFHSDGETVTATFSSEDPSEMDIMYSHLKSSGLPELKISYAKEKMKLQIEFKDRE